MSDDKTKKIASDALKGLVPEKPKPKTAYGGNYGGGYYGGAGYRPSGGSYRSGGRSMFDDDPYDVGGGYETDAERYRREKGVVTTTTPSTKGSAATNQRIGNRSLHPSGYIPFDQPVKVGPVEYERGAVFKGEALDRAVGDLHLMLANALENSVGILWTGDQSVLAKEMLRKLIRGGIYKSPYTGQMMMVIEEGKEPAFLEPEKPKAAPQGKLDVSDPSVRVEQSEWLWEKLVKIMQADGIFKDDSGTLDPDHRWAEDYKMAKSIMDKFDIMTGELQKESVEFLDDLLLELQDIVDAKD